MKRPEVLARFLVVLVALVAVAVPLAAWWHVPLVHARMAEDGGWLPESMQARAGVPLVLRLTSDDVVHGFAVGKHDAPALDILPGKVTETTLLFESPGTYTFYCTRWCGLNHWRMRGTIEVSGSSTTAQSVTEPLYVRLGIDLDEPRLTEGVPSRRPDAESSEVAFTGDLEGYAAEQYYRSRSPFAIWRELRREPVLAAVDDQALWDATAWIWRANTTEPSLEEGARLYAQNCSACHGEQGAGDGVFADELDAAVEADGDAGMDAQAGMIQSPASFQDASRLLSASPALLQGKIVRGGMGTGMPSWGPILTEQQTWSLVAFLYSFQFEVR